MIPLSIFLEGFMSYREGQTLSFENAPLWVLGGQNGVGKSAIFEAITFALYGESRAGTQEELINHQSQKLTVKFTFQIDSRVYRIEKEVKRNSPSKSKREAYRIEDDNNAVHIEGTDRDDGFNNWINKTIGLNYKLFTSSVLLLQGNSETFLRASRKERLKILEDLMGLTRYRKLSNFANEQKKYYENETKILNSQLHGIDREYSDEELKNQEEEYINLTNLVSKKKYFLEQAKERERKIGEIKSKEIIVSNILQELQNINDIKLAYQRFEKTRIVLPIIRNLLKDQKIIAENKIKINFLKRDLEACKYEIQLVEAEKELIKNYIEKQVKEAISKAQEIDELEQSLPLIEKILNIKNLLTETVKKENNIYIQLEEARRKQEDFSEKYLILNKQLEDFLKEESELFQKIVREETLYEQLQKKNNNLTEAKNINTCSFCGQAVTQEYIEQEENCLNTELKNLNDIITKLKIAYSQTWSYRNNTYNLCKELQNQISDIRNLIAVYEDTLSNIEKEKQYQQDVFTEIINSLSPRFQNRITNFIGSIMDIISISFPTNVDLEILTNEKKNYKYSKMTSDRLQQYTFEISQYENELSRLSGLLTNYQAIFRLSEIENNTQDIRSELTDLIDKSISQEITEEKIYERIKTTSKKVLNLNNRISHISNLEMLLDYNQGLESRYQEDVMLLEKDWQIIIEINKEFLLDLENDYARLLDCKNKYLELQAKDLYITRLKEDIDKLISEIKIFSEEPQKTSQEIFLELTNDEKLLAQKEKSYENYKEGLIAKKNLEEQINEANKKTEHYDKIANWLGDKGLILQLLQEIENAIVGYANEILDGLSQGQLKLELSKEEKDIPEESLLGAETSKKKTKSNKKNKESNDVLDLYVYDYAIGNPTPRISVALASGGQRFRIAVSLALAVGRCLSQRTGRINSVIIDEGFGSLDKNGRDDMIQVLTQLQEQLDKIILVSHQEDFTSAFPNGYKISINKDTSQVEILE